MYRLRSRLPTDAAIFRILYGSLAVLLALLAVVFFWALGPRHLTPWVTLLASVTFGSSCFERLKKFSYRIFQLFTVVVLSWLSFSIDTLWRARGTRNSDDLGDLFPLILIAFICLAVGMLMIQIGLRLRGLKK